MELLSAAAVLPAAAALVWGLTRLALRPFLRREEREQDATDQ